MGAREAWLEVEGDQVILISENDGWVYLRRGAERHREPVRITKVDEHEPWWMVWYDPIDPHSNGGGLSVTKAEGERWKEWLDKSAISD
jgi:hypothetical protein